MMNEDFQQYLRLIGSAIRSGNVQMQTGVDGWCDVPKTRESIWIDCTKYRINPKPREVFGIYDSAGNLQQLLSTEPSQHCSLDKIIKFREVIDE